jgi:hydroxypyruvate isomerase
LKQAFANFNPTHNFTNIERITAMGSALSSTAMAATSLKTIFTSLANEDMSIGERLTSSLMGLGMVIPSLIGMFNNFGKALGFANIMQGINAAKTLESMTATTALTSAKSAEQLVQKTGMSLN